MGLPYHGNCGICGIFTEVNEGVCAKHPSDSNEVRLWFDLCSAKMRCLDLYKAAKFFQSKPDEAQDEFYFFSGYLQGCDEIEGQSK